jgi:bifunctional DNA-binding transcriptional regulator/antitoxin component of YhaV-PrlF toxin-antitoxin module
MIGLMAKVTGKFQITLPKALVERCGIRVGDELELWPIGPRSAKMSGELEGVRLEIDSARAC